MCVHRDDTRDDENLLPTISTHFRIYVASDVEVNRHASGGASHSLMFHNI